MQLLYIVLTPREVRQRELEPHSARRVRETANTFKLATSRLDTQGNLITAWQTPRPLGVQAEDLSGWMNMFVIVLAIYLVSNAALNHISIGHAFADQGRYALYLFLHTPRLILDISVLVACYAVFCLGFQYAVLLELLSGWSGECKTHSGA
jgi:hypothetical protein